MLAGSNATDRSVTQGPDMCSSPGGMWRLETFQQVLVQEEEEATGMWCKTTQTLRYATSHN